MSEIIAQMMPRFVLIIILAAVVVAIAYWFFGKGLAFKIFSIVIPVIAMTAVAAVLLGQVEFTLVNVSVIVATVVPTVVIALVYLYRSTVISLKTNMVELQSACSQLSATASQSASTASEQASIVAQVSTTVSEISQTSAVGAESAQEVVSVTSNAVKKGQQGQISIHDALSIMARIRQVGAIVDMVNQLAEQSNLLAVNAGIEAAKAGEQGRGFAVVAAEVRNLAEQSRKATAEIREALQLTDDGRKALEATSAINEGLVVVLEDASDRSRQIAGSAMQQAAGIKQINEATLSLNQASQDNAAAARQIEEAVVNLEMIGDRMRDLIGGRKGEKHVSA